MATNNYLPRYINFILNVYDFSLEFVVFIVYNINVGHTKIKIMKLFLIYEIDNILTLLIDK